MEWKTTIIKLFSLFTKLLFFLASSIVFDVVMLVLFYLQVSHSNYLSIPQNSIVNKKKPKIILFPVLFCDFNCTFWILKPSILFLKHIWMGNFTEGMVTILSAHKRDVLMMVVHWSSQLPRLALLVSPPLSRQLLPSTERIRQLKHQITESLHNLWHSVALSNG